MLSHSIVAVIFFVLGAACAWIWKSRIVSAAEADLAVLKAKLKAFGAPGVK